MSEIELAIIGGTGLYDMGELTEVDSVKVDTPYGPPSDEIVTGNLHGQSIAFLPRHGRGHEMTPSEIPYRANIYALKALGVKYLIAVSACGSLREDFSPGHIVIPDQLFDFTRGTRKHSFFSRGLVAHLAAAHPFSLELSQVIADAVEQIGGTVHRGGTYITVEGPRFSTKAESDTFRQWGMSLIGMTTSPEAFLAAEAEIAYACLAHVTDYDVWHESEAPVTVEMVMKIQHANMMLARSAIRLLAEEKNSWAREFSAHNGMQGAFLNSLDQLPAKQREALAPIIGRHFD